MLSVDWQICFGLAREAFASDYAPRTAAAIDKVRQKKWRRLVDHVVALSPYYKRIAEAMAHPEDRYQIEAWPVLTKEAVIHHFDDLCTFPGPRWKEFVSFIERDHNPMQLFDDRFVVLHSSGSSGQPLIIPFSLDEWLQGCGLLFRHIKPQFRHRIAFLGACRGHFAGISIASNYRRALAKIWNQFQAFDFNRPSRELCDALQSYQPDVIFGYGKAIVNLADMQEAGKMNIQPQYIYSGGEALNIGEAERCAKILGSKIGEIYAATEHLAMGFRADVRQPWQFYEDALILERQATGTYVTNLLRLSLPLIRYQMNDILPKADDESIIGRMEQALWLRNDVGELDFIHPIILAEVFLPGVARFQYVRENERSLAFHLQFAPEIDAIARQSVRDKAEETLRALLRQKAMTRVAVVIVERGEIAPDQTTGKFRVVA